MTKVINVTGLTPKQIAMIEEIVTALKMASQIEQSNEPFEKNEKKLQTEDEQLKQLHQEFSWLVTDLEVKEPLDRSKIYDIE